MKHLLVGHLPTPQSYRAGSVLDHSGGCDRCLAGGDFAAFCGQLWRFYLHKRHIPIGGVLTYFLSLYTLTWKDDPILTTFLLKTWGCNHCTDCYSNFRLTKKQEILGSDPTGLQPLQAPKIYHPESMDTQNDGHV